MRKEHMMLLMLSLMTSEAFVEFDYIAKKHDELTLKKGDIVKDVVKIQPGWYEGVLNDKKGVFPDKFVKLIDVNDVVFRHRKDSSTPRQCKVIFSYQPVHPDELMLNIGDVIEIVGEDEEGWWKGYHSGKEGVFPSNFVEEIFPTKPKVIATNLDELPNILNDIDQRIPNLPPKPTKILCEVKYPYKAQNEDELSLKEGDIITLTNQELPDPGWWEGELNGKIGVFPDNFVVVFKHDEPKIYKDDSKHKITSDLLNLKTTIPTATVSQRMSIESKIDAENKINPPILKKPDLLKKVSPSAVAKGYRAFVGNRKSDAVDGVASSKVQPIRNDAKIDGKSKEKNGESGFDQVERTPLLKDVRAGRAKPPIRRPPTSTVTKDKSPAFESSEDVVSSDGEPPESKASMREWEKHKAPWLEEMKMNQAKRSSTSPISEKSLNTKGLYPELDKSPVENIMSKSMPCPTVTAKISPNDLTDNKTPVSSSGLKAKPNNLQNLSIRNNYSNVDIPTPVSPSTNNAKPPISTPSNKHHTKLTNSHEKSHNNGSGEKPESNNRVSGEFGQETMTLTVHQYSELIDRIQRLEMLVEMQTTAIDELRSKMYIESDKRKLMDAQKLT